MASSRRNQAVTIAAIVITEDYELASAIRRCNLCPIMVQQRMEDDGKAVPAEVGEEAPDRPIAIICEAPGAQEAATSRPLVGAAGRIFDSLLASSGLKRSELVLLNKVRCRPPHNRLAEAPGSVEMCDTWTVAELNAYNPSVVVVMGGTALAAIYGSTAKVGMTRGRSRATGIEHTYGGRVWIATYHPASLLPNRYPQNRELVVADLKLAKQRWEELRANSVLDEETLDSAPVVAPTVVTLERGLS